MCSSPRGLFAAALVLLAVLSGSALVCVQAGRAFDVTVRTGSAAGFELEVQPHGLASCLLRVVERI
jgi:hypothetical protein